MTGRDVAGDRRTRARRAAGAPARAFSLCARRRPRVLATLAGALLVMLAATPAALALPPSNDSHLAPFNVDLTSGFPVILESTAEATWEAGEPLTPGGVGTCTGRTMVATTWYRLVGNGGTVSIDTVGSSFDTVISVWGAPEPSFSDGLPCNDDAGGAQTSAVSFPSVAGKAYLVQVGGCNACGGTSLGPVGRLVMNLGATPPPPPDAPPPPPPIVIAPPDGDGDGIPDAKDACPTIKPTRDANNDGCQDKPTRILSDLKYDGRFIRRAGRVRGITLSRVRLTRVPQGARVRVSCSTCRRVSGRRGTRAFRSFSFTARKGGTQAIGRLNRVQLVRGKQVVVVVTRPDHLGRKVVARMVGSRDRVKLTCLAVGSTSRRVACSTGA